LYVLALLSPLAVVQLSLNPALLLLLAALPLFIRCKQLPRLLLHFNDGNTEFYLLGGGGFSDSVIVTSAATASITSYFQKDVDGTVFIPNSFDEAFQVIATGRYDKDAEVYVEINKQLGVSGTTYYYDRVAYVGRVMNYSESYPADNLVEVTFDLMSRGRIGIHQNAENTGSIIPTAPN
jgi:hypothetical protein